MNSEREILNRLVCEDVGFVKFEDNDGKTIIRSEHHPISTATNEDTIVSGSEDNIEEAIRNVIKSYQDANRWLDSIKEILLIDFNMPKLSEKVHNLAHEMPVRFDEFGDLLHRSGRKVPYPSTEEWSDTVDSVGECIDKVIGILVNIRTSLSDFKLLAKSDSNLSYMSSEVDKFIDELQSDCDEYLKIMEEHYLK